jgi:hypothetical protein
MVYLCNDVSGLILRNGMRLAQLELVLGLAGAFAMTRIAATGKRYMRGTHASSI